jgi:hypothetical protein
MFRKCDNFTRQMLQSWRQTLPAQYRCASAEAQNKKPEEMGEERRLVWDLLFVLDAKPH